MVAAGVHYSTGRRGHPIVHRSAICYTLSAPAIHCDGKPFCSLHQACVDAVVRLPFTCPHPSSSTLHPSLVLTDVNATQSGGQCERLALPSPLAEKKTGSQECKARRHRKKEACTVTASDSEEDEGRGCG